MPRSSHGRDGACRRPRTLLIARADRPVGTWFGALVAALLASVMVLSLPGGAALADSAPADTAPAPADPAAAAPAAPLPTPAPAAPLPAELDLAVEYEGQTICDPTGKPGAEKLKAALLATYGQATIWIPRDCNQGGQSEHKEGRALDWMTGTKPSAVRTAAQSFVDWVTAPDASGVPGGMARRMGIMYIGWDDKIWRAYDTGRGWAELKGCFDESRQGPGYDTYCHRDHVHISMTWDGAAGLTSFWDGSATTVPPCERRTSAVPVAELGTADQPVVILNTGKGKGIASGTPCRLAADRWSGDARRVSVALPVNGTPATVNLRVRRFASNAPATLQLSSTTGDSATVTAGSVPADVALDVGADGVVTASVDAGYAFVSLSSFGTGAPPGTAPAPAPAPSPEPAPAPAPAPAPPPDPPAAAKARVGLSGPSYVRVGSAIALTGSVADAPAGATVRRQVRAGGAWTPVGKAVPVTDGRWSMSTSSKVPALLMYRAALYVDGAVVARSPRRDVRVLPPTADLIRRPIVTLDGDAFVTSGGTLTLSGKVSSAPAGAMVQRMLRLRGAWQPIGDPVPVSGNAWSMQISVPPPPRTLSYRAMLLVDGARVSVSPRADVRVLKATG